MSDSATTLVNQLQARIEELEATIARYRSGADPSSDESPSQKNLSLLRATLESTADGLLVIDLSRDASVYNQKFVQMWNLPQELLLPGRGSDRLHFLSEQTLDPLGFLTRVMEICNDPAAPTATDILELKDGRIFERYSQPQWQGGELLGRVWSFRDITDRRRTEAALAASEAKFRRIVENAYDIICTITQDGVITYLSPNVNHSIGYAPEELVGRSFTPLIHPEDLPRCTTVIGQVMETGQPYMGLEYRVLHKQGHYVWNAANLAAFRDERGQLAIIAIGRDVANQKQAESALAKSQAQFEAILQNANVAIFAKDLEGRYIFANRWVSEEVGLSQDQILGKTDADLLPAELAERLQRNDRQALETGRALRTEETVASPRGEQSYLAIKFPLLDGDGNPYAICGISTNISDLKRTEAALRASEARLNRILDRTSVCIADYRNYADRTIIADYFSSGSFQLWGFTPEELLADLQIWTSRFHPEDLQTIFAEAFDYIFDERPYHYEYRYYHPDGSLRWIQLSLNSYRDEDEDCWRTTVVSIDITDRKRAEEALKASEARLNHILDSTLASIGRYRIYANYDWAIQYFSSGTTEIWGFTPEELIADKMLQFDRVHPEDMESIIYPQIYPAIFAEQTARFEYRYFHPKKQEWRWIAQTVSSVRDDAADCWLVTIIATDVTDRKRAEEALAKSEAKFRLIVEDASDLIATVTSEGIITYISPNVVHLLGYEAAEMEGQHFAPFVHPEDLAVCADILRSVSAGTQGYSGFENRMRHKDGTYRWYTSNMSVSKDENGNPILVSVARDITERKLAEEALRESEAKLNRILDRTSASIADYRVYADRRFVPDYFSSGTFHLWGYAPEELVADPQLYLSRFAPEDLQTILDEAYDYIFNERPYRYEYRYYHPDGTVRWIELSLNSYWDEAEGCWRTPSISVDITDRKRAEEALARSEAQFRRIIENASDLIATVTPEGLITYISPNCLDLIGYTDAELIGQHFANLVHPDDVAICAGGISQVMGTGEPCTLEAYRVLHQDGSFRYMLANVSLFQDEHGNPVILGIARDVTERKRLEEELRRSEAKFRQIVENASDLITTVSPEGLITYISPNALQRIGYSDSELIGQHFDRVVHPDDVAAGFEIISQVLATGEAHTLNHRIVHRDGSIRYMVANVGLFQDEEGNSTLLGITRDVTQQKRLEEELRQSEARFRRIVENSSDLIATANPDGILSYASPTAFELLGYGGSELVGQHFSNLIHPDDLVTAQAALDQMMLTGEPYTFEHRLVHRDGSIRYVIDNVSMYEDENGNPVLLGISRDVTDRKRLEEELRQSEAKFRRIVENANDTIATITPEGIITYLSPNFLNLIGREASEVIGTTFEPLVHPDDLPKIGALMQQGLATGEPYKTEYRLCCSDGTYRYFVANSSLYYDENNNPMMLGISRDFTEQKRLEEELRQSEAKFRAIVENANDYIATVNTEGIITYLSPNMLEFFGQEASALIGTLFVPLVHPEDVPKCYDSIQAVLITRQPYRFEYRLCRWDGVYRYFVTNTSLYYDQNGNPIVLGISRDVTEQKRLEEELRQSEYKFRAIVENANDMIYLFNQEGIITYMSPNVSKILGYTATEMEEQSFTQFVYPNDLALCVETVQRVLQGESVSIETRAIHKDGSVRWLGVGASLFRTETGEAALLGISRDITDRKRLEEELRQSEAKFRAIVENANDLIYLINSDGVITYMSPNVYLGLGYTAAELQGQSFVPLVHPDDLEFTVDSFQRVLAGESMTVEVRARHRDGSWQWFSCQVSQFRGNEGEILQMGIARNITDRKRLEEELRQSEAKFRAIVEQANDIIYTLDQNGRTTYVSPNIGAILGSTPDELIPDHFSIRTHPDDLDTVTAVVQRTLAGEKTTVECRALHRDGTWRWLDCNLAPLQPFNGETGIMGIARDISERKQAELALQESEERYRRIVETTSEGIWMLDIEGNTTYVNTTMAMLLGYTPEEMIGMHLFAFMGEESYSLAQTYLERRQQGIREKHDFKFRRRDGSDLWTIVSTTPITSPDGSFQGMFAMLTDITDRKQAEAALQESEAELRGLFAGMTDVVVVLNRQGRYLKVAPTNPVNLYRTQEEVVGKTVRELFPEEIANHFMEQIHQCLISQQTIEFEYSLTIGDREAWFAAKCSPLSRSTLIWVARDVTDRKQAEAALARSEAQFRLIVENANDLIATVNIEGIFTYLSPNVIDLFGYEVRELLGQPFAPIVHPDDLPICYDAFTQAINTGHAEVSDYRLVHRDGSTRYFTTTISKFEDENGNPVILGISRDITDRKRLEEELRQSEYKFRAIVENANDLIYVIDASGSIVYMAPNSIGITGYYPEEIEGQTFEPFLHPDDRSIAINAVRRAIAGEKVSFETRSIHKDGSIYWTSSNVAPFRMETGEIGLMGISRDITDRKRLEEELRQSEYKFRAIVENANDLIYVIDQNGFIVYMSPNSTAIYGYSPVEMEGRTFDRFVYPDDLLVGADAIQRAISGERFSFEVRSIGKDGSIRWFNSNIAPFRMANGEMALMGIGRDITDRKHAEEALRRSERKYRNIFENSHVGVGRARLSDSVLLECNQRMAEILGFDQPEAVIGQAWGQFCATEAERQRIATLLQERGILWNDEAQIRQRNGTIRWVLSSTRVNFDEDCIDFVIADITDRKRLEEDLRQSQKFLDSVIDNIPLGFFAKDVRDEFRYVLINKCAERFMGFNREEGIGRNDYELLPREQAEFYGSQDRAVVHQRTLVETPEIEVTTREGDVLFARVLKFPLVDTSGTLTHLLCLSDDITERKQREEELRIAKDAAEAANRAKSTFLANMSHELRTPLNVILGFTQLMERDMGLTEQQRGFLTTINRSGEHLLNLINDVLEMSKIEAGRISLNPEPFNLHHLLETLREMFQVRAEAKHLELTFEIAPDLPHYVITDEGKLRQVLINLLSNAVKFTQQGRVTLRARSGNGFAQTDAMDRSPYATNYLSGLMVYFAVEDTGKGIAPEEIEQLFQPFVQTSSGIQVREGTGLGLTISRQFVQLLGGDIQLESTVGQGSTFFFQIPVTPAVPLPQAREPLPQRRVLGLLPGQPTYRLLIVDDRTDNRDLLTHLLQTIGFQTRTATNGQEAIDLWQSWHPDLIWMDMRMPVMDGYEATRQIRTLERDRNDSNLTPSPSPTKIIALTASAFEEQRATILATGCDDLVRKPFREQLIFEKLTEHLGVQFVYAEKLDDGTAESQDAVMLHSSSFQAMSRDWMTALQQAAIEIDADRLLQLIEEIPPAHQSLAGYLADLVRRFCFDEILELIEESSIHE